ncbi:Aste57867_8755 [Aphanomyces stellatus]|uniref:RING-type E3 ubiquitin transferase n=1 Tax=Aphanomyces stellatus TaxID=120398 RepID=A0A485KLA2_9STRA|nr:hypothetical protein As57867_008721 [Aphanomyces stellatus]VFT85641.1 Aste57867_8755 [Aphanomyces stellatus]
MGDGRFSRADYDRHVQHMVHRRRNPHSLYDEVTLIEELTLYDIFRRPRPPVDVPLHVPPALLQAELQCPVCLGVIREAVVIKACLHRFCDKCLKECLRMGIKECPSCRAAIGPKRSALGRDETFDWLVATIYPETSGEERSMADPRHLSSKRPHDPSTNESDAAVDGTPRGGSRRGGTAAAKRNKGTAAAVVPVHSIVVRRHESAAHGLPTQMMWAAHDDSTVAQGQRAIAGAQRRPHTVLLDASGRQLDAAMTLRQIAEQQGETRDLARVVLFFA